MKTFLLLATTTVITMESASLPSLATKLSVGAFVLAAALTAAARHAPVGQEDESGFHLVRTRRPAARGRARLRLWPTRKKLLIGWLFLDPPRPAKA